MGTSKSPADELVGIDRGVIFAERYEVALSIIPPECPDRLDMAAVGGWLAVYGKNYKLIGMQMNRDYRWVKKRIGWLMKILTPYLDRGYR